MKKKKHSVPALLILAAMMLVSSLFLTFLPKLGIALGPSRVEKLALTEIPPWVDVQIIGEDGISRSGRKLEGIENIVIHYVANPGSTAQQNHDWYANPESEVSSHFLIGLEGEVIQCIPLDEFSAASNHRNKDTISIEVCHPDETGKFSDASYSALVKLTAWLLNESGLMPQDVIRHYDITGKDCPRYFVQHEDSWLTFLEDVALALKE
jgi:N-acetylmuramoyl-L-alanine amidase